ncbi:TIGR02281 family clan AA aspartic protease [Undibacterium piscinae]|jgi:aspartyl protease family protein|uniref:TIGR02281 family clan AA aspartic protease n=1 Tax=Undibacterium piscinae TaxID=2495591 RepID=A0A6M4A8A5_9BURK|nr:TIGR02281 family clan AA aspartic protease [Undibacterium piscinae]
MKIFPALCLSIAWLSSAQAADIGVVGLFPGKAVLVVDGNAPKIYAVGSSIADGARLVSTDSATATIELNGKRQTLTLGQHVHRSAVSANTSVTLQADGHGQFVAKGQINGGGSMDMLVDTGASLISIPAADARRMGINYKAGRQGRSSTANGIVNIYIVKLDSIKIGDIELHQVEASVHEGQLPIILLGMSFLNRMDMRRNGEQMILSKRF